MNLEWMANLAQYLGFVILGYVISSIRNQRAEIKENAREIQHTKERVTRVEAYIETNKEHNTRVLEELKAIRIDLKNLREEVNRNLVSTTKESR